MRRIVEWELCDGYTVGPLALGGDLPVHMDSSRRRTLRAGLTAPFFSLTSHGCICIAFSSSSYMPRSYVRTHIPQDRHIAKANNGSSSPTHNCQQRIDTDEIDSAMHTLHKRRRKRKQDRNQKETQTRRAQACRVPAGR